MPGFGVSTMVAVVVMGGSNIRMQNSEWLADVFPFYKRGEWSKPVVVPEQAWLLALSEWADPVGREVAEGLSGILFERVQGDGGEVMGFWAEGVEVQWVRKRADDGAAAEAGEL